MCVVEKANTATVYILPLMGNLPHLPRGHLAIVSISIVIAFDGEQVGVPIQESGWHQAFRRRSPETRRNSKIALLIKWIIPSTAKNGLLFTEQFTGILVVQLHRDT